MRANRIMSFVGFEVVSDPLDRIGWRSSKRERETWYKRAWESYIRGMLENIGDLAHSVPFTALIIASDLSETRSSCIALLFSSLLPLRPCWRSRPLLSGVNVCSLSAASLGSVRQGLG